MMRLLTSLLLLAASACSTCFAQETPPAPPRQAPDLHKQSADPQQQKTLDPQPQQAAEPQVQQQTQDRSQQPTDSQQQQAPLSGQNQTITIPAGTRISLVLLSPIWTRTARHGDSVRAATAFPVAVDTQVALPSGVYVDGVLDKVIKHGPAGRPSLQIHFTRILLPNGVVVPLNGAASEAFVASPNPEAQPALLPASASSRTVGAQAFQQQPPVVTPPPLSPLPGPNYGPIIGLAVGGVAAMVVTGVLFRRYRDNNFLFGEGWQFEMVLQNPVSLDAAAWNADVNL